jgi:hypothetical protein
MARPRYPRRFWTAAEDARLRELYPDLRSDVIAGLLGRTVNAVHNRAQSLGVEKSDGFKASIDACRLRRDSSVGAPFRFKKGLVPANKGLRRPGYGPGRMKATQFKRGQRNGTAAAHWMPIGSTRFMEGYILRKVSDVPNVPYTVNWKLEHHLVWTAAHGPIPPKHRLRFKNGDKADVRLDNLELVTARQMMARNTVHNLPPELAETIQLLGALTRQIRKRDGHACEKQD